jgi:O-antigen/teichoic acid export membrane protein
MRELFIKVLKFVGHLAIPLAAGMALLAPELVQFLYGEQWLGAVPPLQVLCLYGGVMALGSWGYVFNALGKPQINFYLNVGRAIGISSLIYPLTKLFGTVGAAWAVAIPMLVHFVAQVVVISRVLALEKLQVWKIVGVIVRNTATMAVALLLTRHIGIVNPTWSLAFAIVAAGVTYAALNYRNLRTLSTTWGQWPL